MGDSDHFSSVAVSSLQLPNATLRMTAIREPHVKEYLAEEPINEEQMSAPSGLPVGDTLHH